MRESALQMRFRYLPFERMWEVVRSESSRQLAKRIVIDSPFSSRGSWMIGSPIETRSHLGGSLEIGRQQDPEEGFVKHWEMREWVTRFDESTGLWATWSHDDPTISVTTSHLNIDCHAITSGPEIHSLSEMLVNGATNRRATIMNAKSVRLRTLVQFDQVVHVPTIRVNAKALNGRLPGKART